MMYYICIDIGGTSIKYGVLSEKGEIFIDGTVSTKVTEKENFILSDVKKLVRNILDEYRNYEIKGICVSTGNRGRWVAVRNKKSWRKPYPWSAKIGRASCRERV